MRAVTGNGAVGITQRSEDELIRWLGTLTCKAQASQRKARPGGVQPPPRWQRTQWSYDTAGADYYFRVVLRGYRTGNAQNVAVGIANLKLNAANTLAHIRCGLKVLQGDLEQVHAALMKSGLGTDRTGAGD